MTDKNIKTPKTTDTPANMLKATYSNQVHIYDRSNTEYYLNEKNEIIFITEEEYHRKRNGYSFTGRLQIHVLIDFRSRAFYVQYSREGEPLNYANFFYKAWSKKAGNYLFHGLPNNLIHLPPFLKQEQLEEFCDYLQIVLHSPSLCNGIRWKFTERFFQNWKQYFEYDHFEFDNGNLEQINQWAYDYAENLQQGDWLSKNEKPRFEKWKENLKGELRLVPEQNSFEKFIDSYIQFQQKRLESYMTYWPAMEINPALPRG